MIKGTIIVLKALKEHSKTPLSNQKLVRACDAWASTMQFSEIVKTWNQNASRSNVGKTLVPCATQLAGYVLSKILKYVEVSSTFFNPSAGKKYRIDWPMYTKSMERS